MISSGAMRKGSAIFIASALSIVACTYLLHAAGACAAQQQEGPAIVSSQPIASWGAALKLLRDSKFDEAAKQYKQLAAMDTNPGLAYAGLARAYLGLNKVDEASAAAAKAVEVAPALDDAHVALGEVYFRQGRIADAEKEFIGQIQANSKNPRAYLGEAHVSEVSSFHKQARQMLERAKTLDPNDPDIMNPPVGVENFQQVMSGLQETTAKKKGQDSNATANTAVVVSDQQESTAPAKPCQLAARPKSMQMTLNPMFEGPRDIRGYGLAVKVNGVPSKLLLDTGSTGILIDRKIAEKANIKQFVQLGVEGIGDKGAAGGYVGLAESIHIGELEFRNCYVHVIEKNSVLDLDGLIGSDMFMDFLIDIDFPREQFRLNELPPLPEGADPALHNRYVAPEMKTFSPVYKFGRDLVIKTKINDSAPRLFLLDTGAALDSISPSIAREFTKVSRDSTLTVKGLSGSVENLYSGDELTLEFGHLKQVVRDIVAFDNGGISRSMGAELSGIIGFPTLRLLELKIDYRDGLVEFSYDADRRH